MVSRAPSAGRAFAALVRDLVAVAGWRVAAVATLAVLAAAAEGTGLLMLAPLLQAMGLSGGGTPAWPGAELLSRHLGLEGTLALYVLLVAAGALVIALRAIAASSLQTDYAAHLRTSLHCALTAVEWRAFARLRRDEVLHVMSTEVNRTASGVDFLLRLGAWAVEVPFLLAVALRLSPGLTAASAGLAALCLLLGRPLTRRAYAEGQRWGHAWRALQNSMGEDLAGMRLIRGQGLEVRRRRAFGERLDAVRAAARAQQRLNGLARAALLTLAAAATALAVWSSVRVFALALGETLVLVMAFARMASTALRMQEAWRTLAHALPAHGAVRHLLARCRQATEAETDQDAAPLPPLAREVTLEEVCFAYDTASPALKAVSVAIPVHTLTAVVGPSGAGKSTLADILLGLLPPDSGRVRVDGRELAGPLRRQWRRRVGYVPQDAFLFHDTVRANLVVAAPDAAEADIWRVLEQVAAADFVRALPQGLETLVGDRGERLSGGQRQRLALARALLPGPDLLILDEATGALDNENERRVLDTLTSLRASITVVVIAHRASTACAADHVIVLEDGAVVGAGPWRAVMDTAAPALARLGMLQAASADGTGHSSR